MARSQRSYMGWVEQLARHYPEAHVPDLDKEQVLDFLIHLQQERKLKSSTVNQAVCALRTLYRDHLKRRWRIWKDIKIKREEPLPHVLTREEVELLLRTFHDPRYRAFFTVVYQCGLRLREAIKIKPQHIDSKRLVIRVDGKGGKQREVPISANLLARLRRFWAWHRNPHWLFPGVGRGWKDSGVTLQDAMHRCEHSMTEASVWAAMKVAKVACGLDRTHERVTTHTLRHSYATHMLEAGTSVRQVAAYLGHSTLKQMMVYLHLTEVSEAQARVALDTLAGH